MTGKLEDTHISQIWFKSGNTVEFNFNFGCSIVYNDKASEGPLSIFKSLDQDSSDWKPWRTFFFSIKGDASFDFQNNEKLNGLLTGKVKKINLSANEVKVYSKDKEIPSEET